MTGTPMIDEPPVEPRAGVAPRRTWPILVAVCAATGIGQLFIGANAVVDFTPQRQLMPRTVDLIQLAVPALALIAWRVFPRRSWAWLLLIGAVCAVPILLLQLAVAGDQPWIYFLITAGPGLTLIGVLAATHWVWRAGSRGVAAGLFGAAVIIQLVGPVVLLSSAVALRLAFGFLSLVLVITAVVGGAVAVFFAVPGQPSAVDSPVRPSWRLTLVGGLLAASPALAIFWQPMSFNDTYIGNHYLHIGLAFFVIGVIGGAVAGGRMLVSALGAGLLLGTFGALITPSAEVLMRMAVITVIACVVSMILGFAAAASRWRAQIGVTGLAVVVAGLIVLAVLFLGDRPYRSYRDFSEVVTPVLLVCATIAGIAAVAAIGSTHLDRGEAPALLAGLTVPFSLGAIALTAHFTVHRPADTAPVAGMLTPAAVMLLIALPAIAVATGMVRTPAPPALQAPTD